MVEISERVLRLAKEGGWVGVDLDGTTLTYDTWVGWNVFGEAIAPMIERIRAWHAAGVEVRIVTARVGPPLLIHGRGWTISKELRSRCRITGEMFSDHMMVEAIQDKLESIHLPRLKVQCFKDVDMIELWDDRAVQVVPNTGKTLAEEHKAETLAQHGGQFEGARATEQASASTESVDYQQATCCREQSIRGAHHMGNHFVDVMQLTGVCPNSFVPMFEDSIVSMATAIAIAQVPIVEQGSDEARFETERVLTGIELRLLARIREYYRMSREFDAVAEKEKAGGLN